MKVTIEKVKTVEKDKTKTRNLFVLTENKDLPMVEVDYIDIQKDELVFFIPEYALLPLRISNMFKLGRTKAIEDRDHEGYMRLVEDVLLPVKQLYPTPPRKPGTKDRLTLAVDGEDYSWLLGIKFVDPLTNEEQEDEFDLDADLGDPAMDFGDVELSEDELSLLDTIALTSEALKNLQNEDDLALLEEVQNKLESDDE